MFAFVVFDLVFQYRTNPRDWLGRMSPKRPVLCRVRCKTLTHAIDQLLLPTFGALTVAPSVLYSHVCL